MYTASLNKQYYFTAFQIVYYKQLMFGILLCNSFLSIPVPVRATQNRPVNRCSTSCCTQLALTNSIILQHFRSFITINLMLDIFALQGILSVSVPVRAAQISPVNRCSTICCTQLVLTNSIILQYFRSFITINLMLNIFALQGILSVSVPVRAAQISPVNRCTTSCCTQLALTNSTIF
jgi:hypothetical protein